MNIRPFFPRSHSWGFLGSLRPVELSTPSLLNFLERDTP